MWGVFARARVRVGEKPCHTRCSMSVAVREKTSQKDEGRGSLRDDGAQSVSVSETARPQREPQVDRRGWGTGTTGTWVGLRNVRTCECVYTCAHFCARVHAGMSSHQDTAVHGSFLSPLSKPYTEAPCQLSVPKFCIYDTEGPGTVSTDPMGSRVAS